MVPSLVARRRHPPPPFPHWCSSSSSSSAATTTTEQDLSMAGDWIFMDLLLLVWDLLIRVWLHVLFLFLIFLVSSISIWLLLSVLIQACWLALGMWVVSSQRWLRLSALGSRARLTTGRSWMGASARPPYLGISGSAQSDDERAACGYRFKQYFSESGKSCRLMYKKPVQNTRMRGMLQGKNIWKSERCDLVISRFLLCSHYWTKVHPSA